MKNCKKEIVVIVLTVSFLILLVPIKTELKDGGTIKYSAILYDITKRHSIYAKDGVDGYNIGTEVIILFFDVYDDVKFIPNK